jgi:hypothetical protein
VQVVQKIEAGLSSATAGLACSLAGLEGPFRLPL